MASRTLDDLEDDLCVKTHPSAPPTPSHASDGGTVPLTLPSSQSTAAPSQTAQSNPSFVPRTFPFSPAVPAVLKELHLLLLRFFFFSSLAPLSSQPSQSTLTAPSSLLGDKREAICAVLSKACQFLVRTLRGELEGHLALSPDGVGPGRGGKAGESPLASAAAMPLSKACQISIDARALAQALDTVWRLLEQSLSWHHHHHHHTNPGSNSNSSYASSSHLPATLASAKADLTRVSLQVGHDTMIESNHLHYILTPHLVSFINITSFHPRVPPGMT